MSNKVKTNLDYIRSVEHWQKTSSQREKNIIEEAILKSAYVLLLSTCRRFSKDGKYSIEDLMQEASIGVLRSIEKWDSSKAQDSKFITYMMWWVNSHIYNFLSKNAGDIRVPKKNIEKVLKDIKELGEASDQTSMYLTSYIYLDKPRPDGEEVDSVLYNDYGVYSLNGALVRNRRRDTEKLTKETINSLKDPTLKEVIYKRSEGATLQEIGDSMSLTRERIRQLEQRAFGILRNNKKLMSDLKDWIH